MKVRRLTVAVLAAIASAFAYGAPAAAHHSTAPDGLSEAELHSFERFVLGADHAADHARERRRAEQTAAAAGRRVATPPRQDPWALPHEVIAAARNPFDGRLDVGILGTPAGAYDANQSLQALEDDPRAQDGDWSEPFDLPLYAIHAALLPTGKVLWFGPPDPGFGAAATTWNTTWAVLWDPISGELERVDPPLWRDPADGEFKPANIYCAGQAFLASGELLVAGGTLGRTPANEPLGLEKVYTFDPFEEEWIEQPDMEHGRWYPTNVQLPDGRQAIMSGSNELGASAEFYNETIEVFTPGEQLGDEGTLTTLVDGDGDPAERGTSGQPPTGGLYPHMFAMPSGKTLVAGPFQTDSWYLHTPGSDDELEWSQADNLDDRRRYGTGVILPPEPGDTDPSSKVMILGGYGSTSDPETNQKSLKSTQVFDDSNPGVGWSYQNDMQVGRSNQNTVLLPDRSMVQVGGGVGADLYETVPEHHNVELWDPATEQWRLGAAQQEDRAYHSTALLLPDGRVVSAGDDGNPGGTDPLDTGEVYSPPYLFKGPRPTIASAPDTIELGDSFDVETPDDIAGAALIAPGATTHANDMHQRYVPLDGTEEADGVQLTAPEDEDVAPPGYYMLFLVNEAGVPSIAKFVQVVPDQPDGEVTIVQQTVPADPPESFTFTGDLGSFSLDRGETEFESVPAGIHDVTQAAHEGWNLTALSCSDGSATDLILRRARIQVSPGESVTCTFTNTKQSDPPEEPEEPEEPGPVDPGPVDPGPVDPGPEDPGPQDPGGNTPPGGSGTPGPGGATPPGGSGGPSPQLTHADATAFARTLLARRLGDGSAKARRGVTLTCTQRSGGFRCAFRLQRAYAGVLLVRDAGTGRPAAGKLTFQGSCGNLGRGGPSAIRTTNVTCPVARVLAGKLAQGKPVPRAYSCTKRAAPKRTACSGPAKGLSFLFRRA